jgi:hypothetical protein
MADSAQIEQLAATIGEIAYIDVSKWHLYLRDAKLHVTLAERIMPEIEGGKHLSGDRLAEILNNISVPVGGGKRTLPLLDLIPPTAQANLKEAIDDFAREL